MSATAAKDQPSSRAQAEGSLSQMPADALKPVTYEQWQQERAELRAELEKARPRLNKCLDAKTAAQYEARKPVYNWRVEVSYMRQNGKGRLEKREHDLEVAAQNERDAWAMFCDAIEDWPSRHRCDPFTITKLGKVTSAD